MSNNGFFVFSYLKGCLEFFGDLFFVRFIFRGISHIKLKPNSQFSIFLCHSFLKGFRIQNLRSIFLCLFIFTGISYIKFKVGFLCLFILKGIYFIKWKLISFLVVVRVGWDGWDGDQSVLSFLSC